MCIPTCEYALRKVNEKSLLIVPSVREATNDPTFFGSL